MIETELHTSSLNTCKVPGRVWVGFWGSFGVAFFFFKKKVCSFFSKTRGILGYRAEATV